MRPWSGQGQGRLRTLVYPLALTLPAPTSYGNFCLEGLAAELEASLVDRERTRGTGEGVKHEATVALGREQGVIDEKAAEIAGGHHASRDCS